jgi:sugar-specific transcriptional regulator TrmB
MVVNELLNLGLTEKEAEVYLATLQLGQATVQNIAKKAEINRTTAYTHIKSLIARGLLSCADKFGKPYYIAEKPEKFKYLFEQQERDFLKKKETINRLLPELEALYNLAADGSSIRLYKDEDRDILNKEVFSDTYEEICGIFNATAFPEKLNPEHMTKLLDHTKSYRTIYIAEKKECYVFKEYPMFFPKLKIKYLPSDKFNFPCRFGFADHKLQLQYGKGFLMIEDKVISLMMKIIFNLLWDMAEDF